MNFSKVNHQATKFISVALIVAILFSISFGLSLTANSATESKKVTIKTQDKADSLLSEGAIRGIDVSKWQGKINWGKVAADDKNIRYAFIRANYGAKEDPNFVTNMQEAHANGLKVGAYHYSRFKSTETMEAEAEAFIQQLKKVKVTYPVVLDVENHYGLSKNELTELCVSFINKIQKEGYTVMLYTYQNFYTGHLNKDKLGKTPIWIANYKEYPSDISHHVWQHTSYAVVSGISTRVDINIAYKDLSVRKPVEVDGPTSEKVIGFFNETLGTTMDYKNLDIDLLYQWISIGIQKELAANFDSAIEETGALNMNDINVITTLTGKDITSNNIMNYIQARLFYKGLYKNTLTGSFDEHTVESIKAFQSNSGLEANGVLNKSTLKKLFDVVEDASAASIVTEVPKESSSGSPKVGTVVVVK